jgi:hypothetical protein
MSNVPVRSTHALINAALVALAVFALALVGATSAHAQADNFLNGDGHDGTVTFGAGTHVPNAVAPVSGAVPSGATSISIGTVVAGSGSNTVNFAANRLVMVYQSNGVNTPPTSGSQAAYPLANNTAGHWEFARMTAGSATTGTLTFTSPLINTYASGSTQVIAVPEYNGVTITGTINPQAWNGATGGVLVMLASGTVNNTGTVSAAGLGFRGALSYVNNASAAHNCSLTAYDSPGTDGFGLKGEGFYSTAYATATPGANATHGRGNQLNAGGGGNCFNAGGGGGGNVGQGGQGGNTLDQTPGSNIAGGGLGGSALTYNGYQQAPMGGGGGQGDRDDGNSAPGGKGGGVVYVRGNVLSGTGTFSAAGANGTAGNGGSPYDGAGGAGAGGSVVLRFVGAVACTSATAVGGTGGNNGTTSGFNWTPGGGGGGGQVYVQGSSVSCTRTVTGGARGTGGSNTGATAGGNGSATSNTTGNATPVVTLANPVNGNTYATTTPAISGTATNSSTVYVYIDGVFVATTNATGAGAWSYSTAALSQGSHTVMVFSDVNGSQSTQASSTFTVDTVAPAAPVITTPAAATTYTSDTTPTVAGTAEANSTVKVYDGATLVGTTTANGSGNWTVDTSALAVGSHTITATATDAGNNVSAASGSKTIVIDTTTPTVSLSTPANGATYGTTTPALSFTVTETNPGTTTCIIDGGAPVACTSGTNLAALSQGSHTIQVRHTDLAGNIGNSATNTFTIDTAAPAAPVITTPATSPFSTNDTTPTVAGTAEANSTVKVYDGATLVGTTTANGSGNWTLDTSALAVGSHTITATATDAGNNVSAASGSKTIIIDTTAPAAPVVTSPVTPYTTNDTTPTFSGTAEANNNVYIYVDGVLNSVTFSNGSGNWTMDLSTVAAGTHTVYVTSMDAAGNTSPQSSPSRTLIIDTTAPTVNITAPANAATVGPNGNVVFTATDAVGPVTTTCQIDAAAPVSCTSPYAFSALSTGAHSATVVATDAAGNTATAVRNFTVDATPPNTTITGQPNAVTNSTSATFTFTSTESPSTFECQLDANPIATCTSGINYPGLTANASHTFSVRAIDQYGNVDQTPATYTWTIDTTAPVTPSITTPASDIVTNDTTPTIGGLAEVGSTVKVYEGATLIGTAVANGSGNWTLSPDPTLSVGAHTLFATSTDPAGNVSANSTNRVITIDTTAPTVALTVPNVGTTPANGSSINTTTPSITFTVTDANPAASSSCIIDGGAPVTCTSGFTTAALGQGSHTIQVTHTDLAGNVGSSATNTFTVDTLAPSAPVITGGPTAPVASTSASFTFTGEVGATYECYVDSPVNWAPCTSPAPYSSLAQGAHTFHVRQTDTAGNTSAESTRSWSVDTVGPPAPSVSGPSGTVGSSSATITFSDTESPVTFMCKLDGAAYALCTSPQNPTGLANGSHTYSVYAVDALGNAGTATSITWTVDTSLFTTSITAGPTGTVATANNSLSFVATITSGTTYQCKVDGGAFALCTSPYATGALADGSHTFSVYAVDGAQTTPTVTRTYTVDTTGPSITISAPANAATVAPSGNVTFTATDTTGPVTTTCKIDAGSASSCTSPYPYAGLTDGAHSVTIVATDGAGNSSTLVRNFTVDATPPNTTITGNPASVTNSTTANFTFTSTESPSTFECQLDGNPIAACTTPKSYPSLSEGSHTFSVRATDQYGNVDASPATYTWAVDLTAPVAPSINVPSTNIVTSDTTPPVSGLAEANSTVNVYDGATLIGTATANGSGAWALSPDPTLSVGAHVLTAKATDGAGNISVASVSRTITVDTTAPVVSLTAPANGSSVTTNTPAITFSVTETNPGTSFCIIDGASPVACTSGTATPPLAEGSHTVQVTHTDAAGNVGSSTTNTFTVDTQGPPAPTVNGPSGTVALTTATITFSDTEAPVTFKCSLDGALAATCTSPVNLTGLGDGPHSYAVYAVDPLGNVGPTTTINWTVDHTLFTTSITAGPTGTVATPSNSLSFVATVTSGTTYECKVDAGSYAACTSPFNTGALADGSHTFSVRAKNGPDTSPAATRTFTVDTTGPTLSITAPSEGATVGPNGNVTFTGTDTTGPVTYTCKIDAGTAASCGSPYVFTGLSTGPHSVTVVASDNVGNTSTAVRNFVVDAVEPDTSITVHPAVRTSSTSATFGFTSTKLPSTFECQLDSGTLASCTSPTTYPGLAEGTHNIQIRAIDQYGNYDQSPASFIWTVDLTAPVAPSISTPVADLHTSDTTPAIAGLAEPNSTVKVYDGATLIGTATADGSGDWSLSPDPTLAEGPHDITATATDEAGNTSPASSIRKITIDTILPVVTITSPVNGSVINNDSPNITFTATDTNLSLVQCSIDGSLPVNCASPWPTSGLSESTHVVSVQATDETGTNQTVETTTFTVDLTAPAAPLIETPAVDVSSTNPRPSISGSAEPDSTITVYDDGVQIGTATTDGSGDWSFTPTSDLSEGPHPLTVTATDPAGNVSDDSNTRTLTVDTTAPFAPVINFPASDGVTNDATPTIGGTAEPNSSIKIYDGATVVGTAIADGSGAWTFTPSSNLSEGPHAFHATATDAAGNVSTNSNVRTLTVDTVTPVSQITVHPTTVSNNPTPSFQFTSTDGTATFECRLDSGSFIACVSPQTVGPLSDGPHTFEVRAKDPAGNTESPAQSFSWTVDTTPPSKPVVTSPAASALLTDDTPTISGTAEPNSQVQVFVDGNSIGTATTNGSGAWTITAPHLTDGPHNTTARATDTVGNVGAVSDPVAFTLDTTAPDGSVAKQTGTGENGGNPTFDISTSDGTATIRCSLDGATSSPCSSPFTPTGTLSPGTHTLVVTFTDPAGNVTTRTITFVIAGAAVTPPPPVNADPTQCLGGGVVITNLFPKGGKATVSGFARKDLIGKSVTITYNATKKAVATAVVKSDGSFSTTFKAPPKKDWNKNTTTYLASSGGFKSKKTKLLRRTSSTVVSYSGGKLTVSGSVTLPLVKGGGATVKAKTGCTGTWKAIGTTTFKPNGAFSFTTPYAGSGVIFVQVNAVIGNPSKKNSKFKTNSFVVPVVVQ